MHIISISENNDTVFPTNTVAKKSTYALRMSVMNLCTHTGRVDQKLNWKYVFIMDSFWENMCLQQEVSASSFFFFFLARGNRGGANLSVFYLRCEHLSFEGKPLVNTYINIFVQLFFFFLSKPVISMESNVQFYGKREASKIKQILQQIGR